MKKILLFFAIVVFSSIMVSCDEEEAPLQFDIIENSDEDSIRISYYCPNLGPFSGKKEYFVHTNFSAGEIQLECNNCQSIAIETSFRKPCVLDWGASSATEATDEETGIFVTLEKGNVIKINFADRNGDEIYAYYGTIKTFGKVGGNSEQTTININRVNSH